MKDLDAAAQLVYAQMRELGQTFDAASGDSRVRARLTELGLLNPATEVATEASVALVHALSAAHDKLDAALHQQAVAMTLTRHFLHAVSGQAGEVSVEFLPRIEIDRLRQVIAELGELARHEVVSMHPYTEWSQPRRDAGLRNSTKFVARGIRRRSLFHQRHLSDRAFREHATKLMDVGHELRFVPSIPTRLIAFDSQAAVLQVDPARLDSGAVLVRGAGVVNSLVALFEYCWLSAAEAQDVPQNTTDLTDQQRTVLRMLAAGAKDHAIARTMSLSTRTVARLVGELLTKLGAASRFEAGARAAKLGWLD
ncbi:helix-turn-helix transcriptional regulator [Nonomuraea sp. NPDC049152]|uniref:helix-turn-helix transcriptional regulator n=1 Tax=Nonomuraea sp. NPDC049152 TaxID=3154350 RepID=UPI0033CD58D9